MRPSTGSPLASALVALLVAGCARAPAPADWARVRERTPAFLAARAADAPALAGDGRGRVALTYVTRDRAGGADLWLALSRDSGATFATPVRVNLAPGQVSADAADRPLAAWGPGGRLAVAWSERRGDDPLAADLMARASDDDGATLASPARVNDDTLGLPAARGGAALAFRPDGALFAAWSDGRPRRPGAGAGPPALFRALSADGGRHWGANAPVADSLGPGGAPAVAGDADGRLALAWRDPRGPVLALSTDGGVTFAPARPLAPAAGTADGGLALALDGEAGAAAWSTGEAPAGVALARWGFEPGRDAPPRALLDSLARGAHPRLAPFGDALLIALDARPWGDRAGVVAVRALAGDGALTPWLFLGADAREGWLAPLTTRSALVAWVEGAPGRSRVRLARLERAGPRR